MRVSGRRNRWDGTGSRDSDDPSLPQDVALTIDDP